MTPTELSAAVRSAVTVPAAISMYCPELTPRMKRIPCPIHNGTDYNLSYTDEVWHCFVCGEGGDVIKFVEDLFHLTFSGAVRKLSEDFALGLPVDRKATIAEQRRLDEKRLQAAWDRKAKDLIRAAYELKYNALWDEYARLDRWLTEHRPKSEADLTDEYARNLKARELISERIDNEL